MRITLKHGWISDSTTTRQPTNADRAEARRAKTIAKVRSNIRDTSGTGRHSAK